MHHIYNSQHYCCRCKWPSSLRSCRWGRTGTAGSRSVCPSPCTGSTHQTAFCLRGLSIIINVNISGQQLTGQPVKLTDPLSTIQLVPFLKGWCLNTKVHKHLSPQKDWPVRLVIGDWMHALRLMQHSGRHLSCSLIHIEWYCFSIWVLKRYQNV